MLWLQQWVSFLLLCSCKIVSHLFFRLKHQWIGERRTDWEKVRLIVFLNHTSLFETLFLQFLSFPYLWKLSRGFAIPGATKTLDRPIVGKFFRWLSPNMIPITRKRDESWDRFIEVFKREKPTVIIAPEGRMMRPNGLDAQGQRMTVKSGVTDILKEIDGGEILIAYSGGLHHVQKPGQLLIRFFRTIYLNTESLDLNQYKQQFAGSDEDFRHGIVNDLQARRDRNCPTPDHR
jgi:1-acyl-sn-glycerol-3-phosphate acyltransferase